MKKIILYLLAITVMLSCSACKQSSDEVREVQFVTDMPYDKEYYYSTPGYSGDVIPDAETALAVAQVIFNRTHETWVTKGYVAKSVNYDTEYNYWVVSFGKTETEGDKTIYYTSGVSIVLQKKDGKVFKIFYSE